MRSDEWDKKERRTFGGMVRREDEHEHLFNLSGGRCVVCGMTREELRKDW